MHNFAAADLVQTTLATFAFALFFIAPGYLLGMAGNVFSIRSAAAAEKLLFSIAFSFAATPIVAVLLIRVTSYKATITFFLLLVAISLATVVRGNTSLAGFLTRIRLSTWVVLAMLLAWFLLVQLSLADLQIGQHLYLSFAAFDHSVRVPLVEAASRNGVPPRNPFYGMGTPPVLRYFYYWYVVCALPMRLLGIGARPCFNASVFWSGVGVASIIPLFLKHFLEERDDLRRKSVVGIALLTVTGLDLLPYCVKALRYKVFLPDMEWWDPNQVTSWLGSLLWAPHHVASLTACMVGLLALSTINEQNPLYQRIWSAVLSGLAFASTAGLSVYVAFTFALFAILWALRTLLHRRIKTFFTYIAAGGVVLLLSWPYLLDLLSKQVTTGIATALSSGGGGENFAVLAIRVAPGAMEWLGKLGIESPVLLELAKLPVLLGIYLLEFGFFALIAVLYLRRDQLSQLPRSRQRSMAWTLFAVCLIAMSFLKSDTSPQNDLGFRGMLVVQFILLIWAAPFVHEVLFATRASRTVLDKPWVKNLMLCTLVFGVAGTSWQLIALRVYAPLADAGKVERTEQFLGVKGPGFTARTYWMREGYSRLDQLTSPSTTVQYNPVRDEAAISHLYSTHQAAMGDAFCASVLGGDGGKCRKAFPSIARVFNDPERTMNLNLDDFCDEFQIGVLVATDVDPVWQSRESWVWIRPTLLANPSMRAVSCGSQLGGR